MRFSTLSRAAAVAMTLWAMGPMPAAAHQLTVFAKVENQIVLISAAFADGTPVAAGTLRIIDEDGNLLLESLVDGTYPVHFPVGTHTGGLRIEVDAGGGHENYWILTPADLSAAGG